MKNSYSASEIEGFCSRFYGGKRLLITPFAYTATFLALAQGATQLAVINIAANADFVMLGLHHRAQIGAAQTSATKTAPFVRVLLTDSGSNEQFTNGAVDLEAYSTNGNFDNSLAYPRVLAGRSSITAQVTNYAPTAETYTTLDLVLTGVLVREQG